ncbi:MULTISPECIES: hypothetical protein [unclassified Aeromonas]|uniref:hypothetical protein n=1 Tax=unclassified Aeromonas TaxID=257493 RepID=UPI0035273FC1
MIKWELKLDALFVACVLLAIPLFVSGQFFYTGVLNGYGLSPETFAKGFYDVLLLNISIIGYSFSEIHNNGNYNWPLLARQFLIWGEYALISFGGLLVIMARLSPPIPPVTTHRRSPTMSRQMREYTKKYNDYRAYSILLFIGKFLIIWMLAYISMIIPASAVTYGAEIAKKEIVKRATVSCNGDTEIYEVFSLDDKEITKGFYITSSTSSIAIWNGEKAEIFPLSEVKLKVDVCGTHVESNKSPSPKTQ